MRRLPPTRLVICPYPSRPPRCSAVPKNGPLMAASAAKLARHLAPAADEGRPVDIWRELGLMTMDVVGTCAFG